VQTAEEEARQAARDNLVTVADAAEPEAAARGGGAPAVPAELEEWARKAAEAGAGRALAAAACRAAAESAAAAAACAAAVADCSADLAETADLWDSEGKPEAAEADAAACAEAKVGLED
jgi:hypothetical protein